MNRRDASTWTLLIFAVIGLMLAFADSVASDSPWDPPIGDNEPAWEAPDQPGYFVCWNAHGNPLPQTQTICPEGWAGRAPESPIPIDITEAAPVPIGVTARLSGEVRTLSDGGEVGAVDSSRPDTSPSPGVGVAALPNTGGRP